MNLENSAPLIQCDLVAARHMPTLAENCVLGVQRIGSEDGERALRSNANCLPTQHISMPLLNAAEPLLYEVWRTHKPCTSGQFRDIIFRSSDDALFGVVEIDEATLLSSGEQSPLRAAAEFAYRQIFALLDSSDFPYLWRAWNYLPRIHAEECGLERYRQFNIGRHDAFAAFHRAVDGSPAASALGVAEGKFSVAFIAGRALPTRIENPRQISAFAYPDEYGPRSPTFTRAVTVANGAYETLFVSGTASIVGHETVHCGDVLAQTQEILANLTALLAQANAQARTVLYSLRNLHYRIYIRRAEDYRKVRHLLDELLGASLSAIYVQADICRQDLLIEIEAFALRPIA